MLPYCALKLKEAVPEGIPGNKLFLNLTNISYKFIEIGIVIIIISLESNGFLFSKVAGLACNFIKRFSPSQAFFKEFCFF